ncbi:hypothetical protein [Bradyrhizobium zhanjiangense]|uniref:Uncharacterized protein n=1 Tax=Bradyrhizobium zhanjiangense TaxID=1325107 RepID=A0ABY0DH81_9BRAD|nr:hypothetical protein [Bradyrhizobium zhanjiangense]RXG91560.1 hypothetical protein EAS62_24070 [Bradyrhizobium zhanjiangense]
MKQQQVIVPHEWMERSLRWAERSVLGYERGEKERSRAYARPGIDTSVDAQLLGRAGECAFCLFMHIDPGRLDWGPSCDKGWDVEFCRQLIDVKATDTGAVIWPVTKNHFLADAQADLFASMHRMDRRQPAIFEVGGWCTRAHFVQTHQIAPPPARWNPGTKYLPRCALWPMEQLRDSGFVRSVLLHRQCESLPALFSLIDFTARIAA